MGPIQIGSEVKNGPDLNGLFPWNQVHEKYECGHSWWGTNCDTSMLLYQSSTFSMRKVMQNRILVGGWKGKKKTCGKTLPFNRKNCVCRRDSQLHVYQSCGEARGPPYKDK